MNGTIYILLPVHNRREMTRRFVRALKVQSLQDFRLVLIDDGSNDGTAEMVRGEMSTATVISGTGNWWWAGALQQGYAWLRAQPCEADDLVLIINDDTEFDPDFLERAVALLKFRPGTLLLAKSYSRTTGQLIDGGGGMHVDWRRLRFSPANDSTEVNCLSTRGLFLSVEDFLRSGGFFPKILPHYLSDYEFTLRAHRRGLKLAVDDSLWLWADEAATGFRRDAGETFVGFLKKHFSRRCTDNPLAWTAFVALACPWPWKIPSWGRIWYGAVKKIAGKLCPVGRTSPWS